LFLFFFLLPHLHSFSFWLVYATPENMQKYKYVVLDRERQQAIGKDVAAKVEPTLMQESEQA
jgi:hypothetical protein